MQARAVVDQGTGRTFTESARRAQIVHAAIETIAELGYHRASFAQIARRAGLSSTGLISYHFAGRNELIEQVVTEVVATGQSFMQPQIQAASSARDRLTAYIESNVAFMRTHRAHIVAVAEIITAFRGDEGGPHPYSALHERGLLQLEGYLRAGQRAGEFRRFSARVMARAIRAAIDDIAYGVAATPDVDLGSCGRELAMLFDRATQRTP